MSLKTIFSNPEPRFGPDGRPVQVVRNASARVMRLRVDPRDGAVRLTLPRRASLRRALVWVEEQRGWVEAQLANRSSGVRLTPGMTLDVGSATLQLIADPTSRTVRRIGSELHVGGSADMFEARALRWLRAEARRVLEDETRAVAAQLGVSVGRVSVGDPRSRWGSCSSSGDIRYSWRLILAPVFVLRATVAHEVAHRIHMNHGPAFKALEAKLVGDSLPAVKSWLRTHGAGLHGYGRS